MSEAGVLSGAGRPRSVERGRLVRLNRANSRFATFANLAPIPCDLRPFPSDRNNREVDRKEVAAGHCAAKPVFGWFKRAGRPRAAGLDLAEGVNSE
jgi:hypothetical protein